MSNLEITTVEYSRTRQVSQYEPETVKVAANVGEMDIQDAIKELKFQVHKAMGLTKATSSGVKQNEVVPFEEVKEIVEGGKIVMENGDVKDSATTDILPPAEKKVVKKATKKVAKKKAAKKVEKKEEPVKEFTLEEVLEMMKNLAKQRGMSVAKDVLKDFGVARTKEITQKDFPKLVKEIERCLK
jgi:hypothetical protein